MSLSLRDAALEATKGNWGTIDELYERVSQLDDFDWTEAIGDEAAVLEAHRKVRLRRVLREFKDETGFPVAPNIPRLNPDTGKVEQVYKQEALFDLADYQFTANYWANRANYDAYMARSYRDRAKVRLGADIALQFDLWGTLREPPFNPDAGDEA